MSRQLKPNEWIYYFNLYEKKKSTSISIKIWIIKIKTI